MATDEKPLVTFALFAYNQERFIQQAVDAAFSQTYSPLEIILSDDCSPDATFQIMEKAVAEYTGVHNIILNRNERNLGIGGHINRVVKLCSGIIIVAAAGDDISLPERTEEIYFAYKRSNSTAKLIYSDGYLINSSGEIYSTLKEKKIKNKRKWDEDISLEKIIDGIYIPPGCTHAWSREIFNIFGDIRTPLTCEDCVLPFRGAMIGKFSYIDKCLVKYRQHSNHVLSKKINSNSQKRLLFEFRMIFINLMKDINIYKKMVPSEEERIDIVQKRILGKLNEIEKDILLCNSSYIKKIIIISHLILNGASWPLIRNKIGIYLIPIIWNLYISLKIKIIALYRNLL